MPWVSASMPVAAVRAWGRDRVREGSHTAAAGTRCGLPMVILNGRARSVITAN